MSSETDNDDADATADGTTDGGYVHVPGTDDGADATDSAGAGGPTAADEPAADGFGRKGWALTAAIFICALVIPGIIYVYPYAAGWFGLPFFATYLALPLVPALLLGLVAVWSMTAATADDEP
ncbi:MULTISPECIES: hypothetical protein [Halorubrum]|uniref:Uncharacterized protein n=1 Tax=Halorubrum tropicale TaxID=1765655 RepID=A0A0M9AT14_9EURY|nr:MULTISPECIES: hypothetical protein [Halorubrum]KOX96931.1 hypothetical protein AMR74_05730 [Halorubrum tropicale]RLM51195.1 hypothetical protein DVK06_06165 [Halorubrum sp. Atlit-28R]TKX45236.1 hypothetical protein EXE50_04555 [Halorubrum sp. ARQ200]TKX51590.1 hypothetical protein EXE49_01490 [Halorubrum sp. ASP121]TKX61228.1 hypothetical protein EXE48_09335 [Halorubrum sp. ASP1]